MAGRRLRERFSYQFQARSSFTNWGTVLESDKSEDSKKTMEANMERFSKTVDCTKGLAMLLVVLGHIASPLGAVIFSFHVPLFFFVGGIFIKTDYSIGTYVKKGVERLIIPYLIFGMLGLIATVVKNIVLHRPIESLIDGVAGIVYWADSVHMHHYGLVLWFLPALFWGRSFVFLVTKYIRLHPAILMLGAIALAWVSQHYMALPFGLDKGLVALPWIFMGVVFYKYRERWLSSKLYLVLGLVLFLVIFVSVVGMQPLDLATKNIGNPVRSIPYTAAVILIIVWLLHRGVTYTDLSNGRVFGLLNLFGRHSMLVLVLHVYTNNAADILVNHVLGEGYWYVTFIVSAAVVYLFILMKQRYAGSFVFKYL